MRHTALFFLALCIFSCAKENIGNKGIGKYEAKLLTKKNKYEAGENLTLGFKASNQGAYILIISNAFGRSTVLPKRYSDSLSFKIPKNYSRKSGMLSWILVADDVSITNGKLEIVPKTSSKPTLESYFGPRSITAGEQDYSMLINVTTDPFDNVFPDGSQVVFKSQFSNTISEYIVPSKGLISWKNVYATQKSGRILVNTSFKDSSSKELTTIVFPALAEDFKIEADRNHNYADGNQIMQLRSNMIRDRYNNIISDGTLVNFIIENSKGAILKTVAPTINGVAKAMLLHPSEEEAWKIRAYVTGAAKSNLINVEFETAITDFKVTFSNGNRKISIGPLKSFMDQLVPDGILTQLHLYKQTGDFIGTKKSGSVKGFGVFELPKEYYPNGSYRLVCKAAGITKEYHLELHEQ